MFPSTLPTLAELLRGAAYHPALVAETLSMMLPGYGYDRGFDTRVHLRGQG